jgi:hypothetical protein
VGSIARTTQLGRLSLPHTMALRSPSGMQVFDDIQ